LCLAYSTSEDAKCASFNALTLLVGRQDGHPACKMLCVGSVGVDDSTDVLSQWTEKSRCMY